MHMPCVRDFSSVHGCVHHHIRCPPQPFWKARGLYLGRHCEDWPLQGLAPYDPDWYYTHAAAITWHIYLCKTIGISTLANLHDGCNRHGNWPLHHAGASSSVQHKVCQSLENIGMLELSDDGRHHIQDGQHDLDHVTTTIVEAAHEEAEEEDEDEVDEVEAWDNVAYRPSS
ncbi:hypothetical protein M0805_005744 [Coniferiporia weirii]|nr:hypothetical protein M0805_005744 [Coniferiporia weirii]